jgi:hypothetical protein
MRGAGRKKRGVWWAVLAHTPRRGSVAVLICEPLAFLRLLILAPIIVIEVKRIDEIAEEC